MTVTADAYAVTDALETQERTGAPPEDRGLPIQTLLGFYEDVREQPPWRDHADKCVEYYDGNQIDADTMQALKDKGMGPLITNVIAPVVNVVLGMEAKTRTDWHLAADSDQWGDFAEAGSYKLHETERESRADRACSDGYAGQIKAGLGWVEVSRSSNPFDYPYRVTSIHRREMFWDWRDQDPGLDKSLYQIRKRWYDAEQAIAFFPQHADLLRYAVGDQMRYELERTRLGLSLFNSFDQDRSLAIEDIEEWRSLQRRRLALHEVWYRRWMRGYVLRLPDGQVVELDQRNPIHMVLVGKGMARPEPAVYSKLRMSIWAGPNRLMDCGCQKNHTPYVPFWGYREDRTGVPYGLIRAMISPQDEVNARRQKMMWLLGAKRVRMDADALDPQTMDVSTMLAEIARPDAVVVMNPQRTNRQGGFDVDDNLGLSKEQFEIMMESKTAVQEVVGVFNSLLGRTDQAKSGVAIDSLVEQGTTALAEINDNYRFARRLVGERLWGLLREDMIGQRVDVVLESSGKKKVISLNHVVQDESSGRQIVVNDVRAAKVKVALEDVPSSPSYRQQQMTMLAEVMKGMPPQLQAAIAPFYLEASDLQKRREMAQAVRSVMGQAQPETPEQVQAAQQAQAMQQRAAEAEISVKEANAMKLKAEARKALADAGGNPEAQRLQSQVDEVRQLAAERERTLKDELARLTRQLKQAAAGNDVQIRIKEIEREIKQIEADRDRDVAKIEAEATVAAAQAEAKERAAGQEPANERPAAEKKE